MEGMHLLFKLQKEIKTVQDNLSGVLLNGQVDKWEKYQYMVGQLKAYQIVLQEISNLLKDKEHENEDTTTNIHKLKPKD
jgi:hypothetical protein|tara:strand:- start:1613 stop:1849 length:237 start_codon:yes stop_codon:yes gene_type:complete